MTIANKALSACLLLQLVGSLGCDDDVEEEPRYKAFDMCQRENSPVQGESLAVDVLDANHLFFVDGAQRFHLSHDGGQTWHPSPMSKLYDIDGIYSGTVAGQHFCLRRRHMFGHKRDWNASCTHDNGLTWKDVRPLELYSGHTQVPALFIHQSRPERIFAIFTDNPTNKLMREGKVIAAIQHHTRIAYTENHGEAWTFINFPHCLIGPADMSNPDGITLAGELFDFDLEPLMLPAKARTPDKCERRSHDPWDHLCHIQGRVYGAVNGFLWRYLSESASWQCEMPKAFCDMVPSGDA